MRKKIILHIGTHKTGTTAIQVFLDANREKLLEKGWLYPESGRCVHRFSSQGHHRIPGSLNRGELEAAGRLMDELKVELDCSPVSGAIISSENFEWMKDLNPIKELFKAYDVQILVYLRRQDDYLESLYQQQIRDFKPRFNWGIQQYMKKQDLVFLNYKKLLIRWGTVFGEHNLLVRNYSLIREKKVDIIDDVLNQLNIKRADLKNPEKNIDMKTSMHPFFLDIIRSIKPDISQRQKYNQIVKNLFEIIPSDSYNQKRRLLSTRQRRNLLNKYRSSNQWVAHHYMPESGKQLFSPVEDGEFYRQMTLDGSVMNSLLNHISSKTILEK